MAVRWQCVLCVASPRLPKTWAAVFSPRSGVAVVRVKTHNVNSCCFPALFLLQTLRCLTAAVGDSASGPFDFVLLLGGICPSRLRSYYYSVMAGVGRMLQNDGVSSYLCCNICFFLCDFNLLRPTTGPCLCGLCVWVAYVCVCVHSAEPRCSSQPVCHGG